MFTLVLLVSTYIFTLGERWNSNPDPSGPRPDALPLSYAHSAEGRTRTFNVS